MEPAKDVTEISEFFKKAELSQLEQIKQRAWDMILLNKDTASANISEYDTQWIINVNVAIPKIRK